MTEVFAAARPRLVGVAYRMLGSTSDAEDVVQDAWVKWSGVDHAEIDNPDAYLTVMVGRLALDALRRRRREQQRYVGPWLPEPIVSASADPAGAAEVADSLTMAFLLLLERLSPDERAAFLLADVFGEPFTEIAAVLDRSEAACRQLASRGRRKVRSAPFDRGDTSRVAQQLVDRFLRALTEGDEDAALECVADDAVMMSDGGPAVRAARRPVVGPQRIVRLLMNLSRRMPKGVDVERSRVGGAPGIVLRMDDHALLAMSIEVQRGQIARVLSIANPDKLRGITDGPASIE